MLVARFRFYAHMLRLGIKQPAGVYLEKRQICSLATTNLGDGYLKDTGRTIGNSIMVTQTGSAYISESTIDIIRIPIANLRFSTTASSKRVSLGDCDTDRQLQMDAEIGTWAPTRGAQLTDTRHATDTTYLQPTCQPTNQPAKVTVPSCKLGNT